MLDDRDLIEKALTLDLFGLETEGGEDPPATPPKYQIKRPVGRGGFGAVYLAKDVALERDVALKFLTNAQPADLERFRREARFTARIQNPSIVQVYELGEVDGAWFIAMQFIDGGHLGEAKLPRAEIVPVYRTIARALCHAHREGIIHRDIKPENILLDTRRRPFITDFGIARDLRQSSVITISRAGTIIGTPAFMAPEQARGELDLIDARSDVYSLGATLYHTLTGRRPFEGGNLGVVLHAVIYEEPRLPRSFDVSIPRQLESVVMRCLRKDPADRFRSMEELAVALEESQTYSESRDWFRRLVGGPAPAPLPERRPDHRDPVREAIAREIYAADADLYRASSVTRCFERLDRIIHRLDGILLEQPDAVWARLYRGMACFRRDRLPEAVDDMERSIDRVGDIANAHFEIGRLYLALYLRELQIARGHIAAEGTHHHIKSQQSRLGQAAIAFDEARRIQRDLPEWQLRFVTAVTALAHGQHERCIEICEAILHDEPDREEVWKFRGDALQLSGADPIESYDAALAIRRTYYEACYAKAEALFNSGDTPGAVATLQHAVTIHPGFADGWSFLGRARLRDCPPSEEALSACLEPLDRALSLDSRHFDATVTRAEVLWKIGRATGRQALQKEALRLLDSAKSLAGCQNRVNVLIERVQLGYPEDVRHHGPCAAPPEATELERSS